MTRQATVCLIEACDKVSGVPGTARGLCSGHYQRWKRWGDPLADHRAQRRFCTIDGCKKPRAGRGLCGAHWYHWKAYGDPARRLPGEIIDGKRICPRCRADRPLAEFGRNVATGTGMRAYCKECTKAKTAEWRKANPDYVTPPRDAEKMRQSSADYRRRNPGRAAAYNETVREWYRSYARVWRKRNPEAVKTQATARRTRRRNAYVEPVSPILVYRRDGWICGICIEPIDPAIPHPDPMSASVDHIVPLARHGKHSLANVQAAHLACNMSKGVKILLVARA